MKSIVKGIFRLLRIYYYKFFITFFFKFHLFLLLLFYQFYILKFFIFRCIIYFFLDIADFRRIKIMLPKYFSIQIPQMFFFLTHLFSFLSYSITIRIYFLYRYLYLKVYLVQVTSVSKKVILDSFFFKVNFIFTEFSFIHILVCRVVIFILCWHITWFINHDFFFKSKFVQIWGEILYSKFIHYQMIRWRVEKIFKVGIFWINFFFFIFWIIFFKLRFLSLFPTYYIKIVLFIIRCLLVCNVFNFYQIRWRWCELLVISLFLFQKEFDLFIRYFFGFIESVSFGAFSLYLSKSYLAFIFTLLVFLVNIFIYIFITWGFFFRLVCLYIRFRKKNKFFQFYMYMSIVFLFLFIFFRGFENIKVFLYCVFIDVNYINRYINIKLSMIRHMVQYNYIEYIKPFLLNRVVSHSSGYLYRDYLIIKIIEFYVINFVILGFLFIGKSVSYDETITDYLLKKQKNSIAGEIKFRLFCQDRLTLLLKWLNICCIIVLIFRIIKLIYPELSQYLYIKIENFDIVNFRRRILHKLLICVFYLIKIWHFFLRCFYAVFIKMYISLKLFFSGDNFFYFKESIIIYFFKFVYVHIIYFTFYFSIRFLVILIIFYILRWKTDRVFIIWKNFFSTLRRFFFKLYFFMLIFLVIEYRILLLLLNFIY